MRFLIIQTAFLGDVVLGTALAESLHGAYPNAQVDMLVRRGNEGVLAGHPWLGKVLVWNKTRKYTDTWRLLKLIRNNRYDGVVCVQRFATMGAVAALSGAEIISGFGKNPFAFGFAHRAPHSLTEGLHEVERSHALLAPWPEARLAMPRLYPTQDQRAEAAPYQPTGISYVCLAPASVWATKQWPADKWARLAARLLQEGYRGRAVRVLLVGGPADAALAERIRTQALDLAGSLYEVENLAGKLSLMGSAALLAGAERLWANDSGPVHLASAVGCPTTVVYCSTVPAFGFGPLAEGSMVWQEGVGLPCRPCGLHGHNKCPRGHFLCATSISPELGGVN